MSEAIHATALVLGASGLLIRGAPGAGKSSLGQALITRCGREGRFARLVGDDRIRLESVNGRLVARPVPAVAGLIEARGIGILAAEHEPACVIRAVLDLSVNEPERLPETSKILILGLSLPWIAQKIGVWTVDRTLHFMRYQSLL